MRWLSPDAGSAWDASSIPLALQVTSAAVLPSLLGFQYSGPAQGSGTLTRADGGIYAADFIPGPDGLWVVTASLPGATASVAFLVDRLPPTVPSTP